MNLSGAQELLSAIAADLQIRPFAGEAEEIYAARLLYSALGLWTLYCAEDCSLSENREEESPGDFLPGSSKTAMLKRCAEILSDFLSIIPQARTWFVAQENGDCSAAARRIRSVYEAGGYLVPAGAEGSLVLPQTRSVLLKEGLALVRGTAKVSKMIGLGLYEGRAGEKEDIHSLYNLFLLPCQNAEEYVGAYLSTISWTKGIGATEGTLYFDPGSPYPFSQSWIEQCPRDTPTLYKKGMRDYGLIMFRQGEYTAGPLPEHVVKEYEVRRFLYGLKGMRKKKVKARLRRFRDVALLQLYNALPRKESVLLKLLAWPVGSFDDEYRYYVPLDVLDVVQELLSHLCMELEEM